MTILHRYSHEMIDALDSMEEQRLEYGDDIDPLRVVLLPIPLVYREQGGKPYALLDVANLEVRITNTKQYACPEFTDHEGVRRVSKVLMRLEQWLGDPQNQTRFRKQQRSLLK